MKAKPKRQVNASKVLKHLKEDVKESKESIKEDKKLAKSLKKTR